MSERYPQLRWNLPNGRLGLREGVVLSFFMPHPHPEIAHAVENALDIYLDTVGGKKLGWVLEASRGIDPDEDKGHSPDMVPLDEQQWKKVREGLRDPGACDLKLEELPHEAGGFRFNYHGASPEGLYPSGPDSHVSFWLPTEYLEAQGYTQVKALAVKIARALPFSSGHVGFAFNVLVLMDPILQFIQEHCLRYPGMDITHLDASTSPGARIRGVSWLNFYSPSTLDALGGIEELKALLAIPGVSVEEWSPQQVLVSLGDGPDMNWTHRQGGMEPYRALARLLKPHLLQEDAASSGFSREHLQRWRRRFLD